MPTSPHFTPELFEFLRGLAKNNTRMANISSHIHVNPKLVGGSMQRMNRDTRFSKDKSPYKTNVGAMFGHASAVDGPRKWARSPSGPIIL